MEDQGIVKDILNYFVSDKIRPHILASFVFAGIMTIILFTLENPNLSLVYFQNGFGVTIIFVTMFSVARLISWLLGFPISFVREFYRKRKKLNILINLQTINWGFFFHALRMKEAYQL